MTTSEIEGHEIGSVQCIYGLASFQDRCNRFFVTIVQQRAGQLKYQISEEELELGDQKRDKQSLSATAGDVFVPKKL